MFRASTNFDGSNSLASVFKSFTMMSLIDFELVDEADESGDEEEDVAFVSL